MESNVFINAKNILTIICLAAIVMLISLAVSLVLTPKFKASTKLLVVYNNQNVDTFTASQTSNYVTGILNEVIYSESFIKNVFASNFGLRDNLGANPENRQKNWRQIIKTQIVQDKGIIMIDVYGADKDQVNQLANSVAFVLITKHSDYDGSGNNLALKMIDSPVIFDSWSAIKVIQDSLIGLAAGLLLGLTFIIIFPQHRLFEGLGYVFGRTGKDELVRLDGQYYPATDGQSAQSELNQEIHPPEIDPGLYSAPAVWPASQTDASDNKYL